MSKWEMVKLGDVCEINMGQSPTSDTYNEKKDGIPFYQGNADFGQIHPVTIHYCNKPTKVANKFDVLLSVRAPIGAINIATERCCIGRGLCAITQNESISYYKYIYYVLKKKNSELKAKGTGSTFKAINKASLINLKIPLPPLNIQKQIADTLDKAQEIIDEHKKQLEELENLIKAIFYDMFGDPVTNERGWKIQKLDSLCTKITDGKHGDCENDENSGYYFVSAKDIVDGEIKYDNSRQITVDDFLETNKRTQLMVGDIAVVNTGATIGKTALVKMNEKVNFTTFQKSVAIIQVDKSILNNVYLQQYIIIDRENIYRSASGSAQKNWLLSQMRNYKIIVPSIDLQNKFATIVANIEEQKAIVRKSIEESQNLFNSLMSKYFD